MCISKLEKGNKKKDKFLFMFLKVFLWWCSSGTYVVFLFSHFNSVPFVSALLLTQTAHLQYTMATLNTLAVCPLSQLPFVCPAPTLISLKHKISHPDYDKYQ